MISLVFDESRTDVLPERPSYRDAGTHLRIDVLKKKILSGRGGSGGEDYSSTDGPTERPSYRDAGTHLRIYVLKKKFGAVEVEVVEMITVVQMEVNQDGRAVISFPGKSQFRFKKENCRS